MEQAQEQPKFSIRALLELMSHQQQGEALYDAFVESLDGIPNQDVKADICLNTVKYVATQNARIRAKDESNLEEVCSLFEEECKRFSVDMLAMPDRFREWIRDAASRQPDPVVVGVSILDLIIGSCECEHCMRFKKATQAEREEAAVAPTEPPPAP